MVIWLGETKGLEPYKAYMICSCAGDLKISEIVDQQVGGQLPHAARDLRHAAHAAQLASS